MTNTNDLRAAFTSARDLADASEHAYYKAKEAGAGRPVLARLAYEASMDAYAAHAAGRKTKVDPDTLSSWMDLGDRLFDYARKYRQANRLREEV